MTSPSRRDFFEVAGALLIDFSTSACSSHSRRDFRPNAWLRITPDDQITVFVEIPEMGQGSRTVDTIMLAEELEADWRSIRVEQAPVQPAVYKKLSTGGSGGTANMWDDLPRAGAQAREMLITAAAQNWRVPRNECRAQGGAVIHRPTGRRLRYGELAAAAAALPAIPADRIRLKNAAEYRLVGKPAPSVDIPSKVDGSAVFGIDVRVPGMLFATIAQCPHFGGSLKSFDASAAKAMPGVRAVFAVPPIGFVPKLKTNVNSAGGVAVVAESTWAAIEARKALRLEWNPGPDTGETTAGLAGLLRQAAGGPASFVAVNEGNVDEALGRSHRKIEAYYELPFQAHATMEPMNTTVHVRKDGIEVWSPTQIGAKAQEEIAILSGLPPDRITVHMMLCGGSFGRRYQWDYIAQAWQVANEVKVPVQLLWTREDDLQHDFYRQSTFHQMAGGVDDRGNITAWKHRVASTSIRATFGSAEQLKDPKRVASQELGGADVLPYAAASRRLDYAPAHSAVPRAWWRSVESSFNGFALECFVDELAHLAGRDPYRFRMDLLSGDRRLNAVMWPGGRPLETARLRAVLREAAEKSGWGTPMAPRCGRGIACFYSFETYVAYVAEVCVERDGAVRVRRLTAAVDCGLAVNPNGVRAMIQGGANFALTPVLTGEITVRDAAVEQANFHQYRVLRMDQAPDIDVHILSGGSEPGGMGEAGVPALAPAVANAVFAATGKRVRRLPIDPRQLAV